MIDYLHEKFPDTMLVINEDTEARIIAMQFGLDGLLAKCPVTTPYTLHAYSKLHLTHWAVVGRGWNHADPKENGWIAMFIPKAHKTEAELKADFETYS